MSTSCNNCCSNSKPAAGETARSDINDASGDWLSTYRIPRMDCPSEERMIRMALGGFSAVQGLSFDLPGRTLEVLHNGEASPITDKLSTLGLGAELRDTRKASTETIQAAADSGASQQQEAGTLWILLAINGLMFVFEMVMGLIAQSAGLIADSLDMFADAAVYGLALYAVGHGVKMQVRAAHVAGIL
jgi:cation transport ATPase